MYFCTQEAKVDNNRVMQLLYLFEGDVLNCKVCIFLSLMSFMVLVTTELLLHNSVYVIYFSDDNCFNGDEFLCQYFFAVFSSACTNFLLFL